VQSRFDYTYDANGNRMAMTTLAGTTSYAYDVIGQLVGVTYPDGRHVVYTYDAEGNRVAVSDNGAATAYAVNNMNQYTQVGGATYTYDADGNMTSKTDATGTTTYQYDAENRLVRVVTPADGAREYTYDALSNRASISYNGAVTRFIHDPTGLMDVAAEYDGSGVLRARYIHGFGLVARVDGAGASAYYAFDAGGNTRQMTDGSGGIANTYDYDPFGIPLLTNETIPNSFRYVGRLGVMAEANGLQFMRARYYSGELGRFITVDPIGLLGGDTNLYTYAGNDPINASDPQGTFIWVLALAGAAAGGALNAAFYALGQAVQGQPISGWDLTGAFVSGALYGGVVGGTGGLASWGTLGSFAGMATLGGITSGFGHLIGHGRGSSLSGLWGSMVAGIATGWIPIKMLGFNGKWGMNMFGKALRNALLGHNKTGKSLYGTLFASMAAGFLWSIATNIVQAIDPNDKLGPAGIGSQRTVPADGELTYTIDFENTITATASVQELVVVDQLDPNLDWTTFQFSDVAYGSQLLSVSGDSLQFSARDFPTPPTITGTTQGPMAVDITASLNPQTRRVEWRLKAIDTATGLPPEDPFAGFLPPEDGTGHGQGHVSFSVRPNPGIAIGTRITNTARIVFDSNDPIATNAVWNTIGDLSQLQFEAGMYEVDENAGTATVAVRRVGGQLGRVTINYATSNGSATAGADYVAAAGTLTFADGDTTDKMITVTIKDDTLAEGNETLFLTLSVPTGGATLGEPKTAMLTIADNEALPTGADLAISKVANSASVAVGCIITYTITVANHGPNAASGVILTDPLPAGLASVSATASQGACDGTSILTCGLGTLDRGASARVVIAASVTITGIVTNTATVTAHTSDTDLTNNTASAAVAVSDVTIRKIMLPLIQRSVSTMESPQPVPVAPTDFDCATVTQIPLAECQALVALYTSTNGAGWTNRKDWLVTDMPCSWRGVYCSAGHVQALDLTFNKLTGTIPPELRNLSNLEGLNLVENQIGGAIPSQLGDLVNLKWLVLAMNPIGGRIPPELGKLSKLEDLEINDMQLSGGLPPELGNLSALHNIYLSNNLLTGSLPRSFMQLNQLHEFYFDHTGLCVPGDDAFQTWLASIPAMNGTGVICRYQYLPILLRTD
jgi:RHS repeat-associated protein/uncharacterized repeat protein (TIGR01451 family)